MSLADLQQVLRPAKKPKHSGSPEAWAAAEAALGIQYPPDFKEFVGVYGSGAIGQVITIINPMAVDWAGAPGFNTLPPKLDKLLESLNPFGDAREQWLYSLASTLAVCDIFKSVPMPGGDSHVPMRMWPELPGLFVWGRGDSGQALMWWMAGVPERWPVVLADPTEGLRSYPMDLTSVVTGWLSGATVLESLPQPANRRFSQRAG